ncbi:PDGF- and VEGF-related factor 1 isoform 2-T6 [Cochliomyia hominivorax]
MSQINTITTRRNLKYSVSGTSSWFCHLKMFSILALFTCSLLHCVQAAAGENDARFVYNKSNTDAATSAENTDTDTNVKLLEENETDPIPMDFYRQLNNITDISEFIEKFIDPESIDPQLENLKRNVERAAVIRAKAANCMPENTVVDLTPINPKNNYFPRCTRVKRCSGCCSTQWMACQPTKTEIVNFQVYRYCYEDVKAKFCGFEVIPVEQHLECKCDCRKKPEDCNAYQRYQDCRCHCINDEAREKCLSLDHKIWDDENCRCVCKQNENCTTGSYYDENQCKCLLLNGGSDVNNGDVVIPPIVNSRRRFYVKPIEVDPDNSTIYQV